MSSWANDINVIGATRIAVGLSTIIKVTCTSSYQFANSLKWLSGGSLEIVQPQFSGSSTQAGSASLGWGSGYILGTSEVFNVGGPATFYLAATGATAVAAFAIGYTQGAATP